MIILIAYLKILIHYETYNVVSNTVTVMRADGTQIQVNTSALQAAKTKIAMGIIYIYNLNDRLNLIKELSIGIGKCVKKLFPKRQKY